MEHLTCLEVGKGVLQVEALDKGLDVILAFWGVVLLAHFDALVAKHGLGSLPMQCLLLLGAIIQKVHPKLYDVSYCTEKSGEEICDLTRT